ncbi:heterokaryon incompatibility protein-domain-containing protein [Apiospora marii]|uniref:heterokaryon incompatibility protein-domain-containing protein n=1 Tax=Apiospora marii TaxID=335849 RepID=UPI0031326880
MRLLNTTTFRLESVTPDFSPRYAVLSHRWTSDEVSFREIHTTAAKKRPAFDKIRKCCEVARRRGLSHVWIDTCCIDQSSSAELSEAINSMFRWYQKAEVCFAYLHDAEGQHDFTRSDWFNRGWTLQWSDTPVDEFREEVSKMLEPLGTPPLDCTERVDEYLDKIIEAFKLVIRKLVPFPDRFGTRTINEEKETASSQASSDQPQYESQHTRSAQGQDGEVSEAIADLADRKSSGVDMIANEALKMARVEIVPCFEHLFDVCFKLQYHPRYFKASRTIAVPKGGKPAELPTSNRPISLLSAIGKLLERLIVNRIKRCLEKGLAKGHNILPAMLFGGLPGESTTMALATMIDFIRTGWRSAKAPGTSKMLPKKLRKTFTFYATVDGGYKCNAETLKLVCADGSRIDKSLVFTCKQIAEEMTGVGFRCNTLNFATFYSDATRVTAARWENFWNHHLVFTSATFEATCEAFREKGRTELAQAWVNRVASEYPDCAPVLHAMLEQEDPARFLSFNSWGITPSTRFRSFLYSFQASVDEFPAHPDWSRDLERIQTTERDRFQPLYDDMQKWKIPTPDEVDTCANMTVDDDDDEPTAVKELQTAYWESPHVSVRGNKRYTQGKYRFSAASVAHSFLTRLPKRLRTHLRSLHVHEDHVSVATPSVHAQGLISFCLENPWLRIVRRVDLWRTVLVDLPGSFGSENWEQCWLDCPPVETFGIVCLADWLSEALVLPSYGMPEKSYTLLLDASESREQCTNFFQLEVQRIAAWQDVLERVANERGIKSLELVRSAKNYVAQGFPKTVSDIANNASPIIKTTFDASQGNYDADKEYDKYRDRDFEHIRFLWGTELADCYDPLLREFVGKPAKFEFHLPLPSYKGLLAENILPEFFTDQDWSRVDADDSGESESEADSDDDEDDDDDDEDDDDDDDDETTTTKTTTAKTKSKGMMTRKQPRNKDSQASGSAAGVYQGQLNSHLPGDGFDNDDDIVYYSDLSD